MESPTCSSSTVHTELLPSTKRVTLQLGAKQATPPRILLTVHPSRINRDWVMILDAVCAHFVPFLAAAATCAMLAVAACWPILSSKMLCRLSKQILGSIVCCQHSPHACCQCDNAATTFHGTAMFSRLVLALVQHDTDTYCCCNTQRLPRENSTPALPRKGVSNRKPALLKQGVRELRPRECLKLALRQKPSSLKIVSKRQCT